MDQNIKEIFILYYQKGMTHLPNVVSAIVVVVVFIIIGKILFRTLGRRIQRQWQDKLVANFLAQATKWSFYILGLIIGLNVVGFGNVASSILAGAGISAVIFGFAFKDIGENFLSGILLALNRPFEVGDIIEVAGNKGTVRHLELRSTHIRNAEGKDIYIPNSTMIKQELTNYTKDGLLRISFMVGIAPENDLELARRLITDYLEKNKEILGEPSPNVLVQELGEFTVDLQVLFWIDILESKSLPENYMGHSVRSKAISEVKRILEENNFDMPSQVLEHKMYRDKELLVREIR